MAKYPIEEPKVEFTITGDVFADWERLMDIREGFYRGDIHHPFYQRAWEMFKTRYDPVSHVSKNYLEVNGCIILEVRKLR